MRYLQTYLDRYNFNRVNFYKKPAITLDNMTQADAEAIADTMASEWSPENLTCDGELSRAQVQAKARLLKGASRELIARFPLMALPEWDDGLFVDYA